MGLVIHDLSPTDWDRVCEKYEGWTVVSDRGTIRPCVGCFSCWNRTPGQCVIRDGYENMGALIHHADEVVVISRYTYGGFSGFVKNVFDRCLSYVLPQFEVINEETHHKKRYDEDKPFTFIFHGPKLTRLEKDSARKYVTAVCANIRGHVKDVLFWKTEEGGADDSGQATTKNKPKLNKIKGKVVLLNGSMRSANGNSAKLARRLYGLVETMCEIVNLSDYINCEADPLPILDGAGALVLCVPLYVDGLPSQVVRFMKRVEDAYDGKPLHVYVLANMGLYENKQLENLFSMVRQWCGSVGFLYCGGLGVSAGELVGGLMDLLPFGKGPLYNIDTQIDRLALAIDAGEYRGEFFRGPGNFPRWLYIQIANRNWNRTARRNGIRPRDLYRQL